jgi:phosphate transport system permease protein
VKKFWKQGEPFVWATAGALTMTLLLTFLLLAVVAAGGLGVFWPARIAEVELADGTKLLGQRIRSETAPDTGVQSVQFKTGNRDLDPGRLDFRWVEQETVKHTAYPPNVFVLERVEHGNFHGYLKDLVTPNIDVPSDGTLPRQFAAAVAAVRKRQAEQIGPLRRELSSRCTQLEGLRGAILKVAYHKRRALRKDPTATTAKLDARLEALEAEENRIKQESDDLVARQQEMENAIRQNVAVFADVEGRTQSIALVDVVRSYNPNAMGWFAKVGHYLAKVWELLTGEPRESNTEGGLFPAIFGTVMLIFVMAITCFPLGVLAGVYLGEYAKDGVLIRLVRIAVNNLAGIPSIVYGIFGLGFFIYGVGGVIDDWFYPELVEAGTPVFGTGGILWASLTLGLLTIPVVIVSTEEALRAIPQGIHEGSLAVGATKLQTLLRVLLPMASPGIMTGFILAMARAAGEVAPLMITGVVKLAPDLAMDGNFPFFHLDRKFMHLGFHIYDVGFQSPNVEASKPMVYVTTLLLLVIVLTMSSVAIYLRNRMRKRFQVRSI